MDFARAGERPVRRAWSAPAAQPGDGISNQFLRQGPTAHGYFQPQRSEAIIRSNFLRFPPALNKNAEFGNSAAPRRTTSPCVPSPPRAPLPFPSSPPPYQVYPPLKPTSPGQSAASPFTLL